VSLEPALVEWLARTDHAPVTGWAPEPPLEELHCNPDLIERVSKISRPIKRTVRVFVAGCPVIHHPAGPPIAAASGTSWFVVRRRDGWDEVDPWQTDIALAQGIDLVRARVASAFAEVESGAWH
jgi:hypothetical protein